MRRRLIALLFFGFACDSSAKVGEVRPEEVVPDAPEPVLGTGDAAVGDGRPEWRLKSPLIPCSIYAIDEVSDAEVYAGCNGGQIYRFDGVRAELAFSTGEKTVVSLLQALPNGEVWAGAQSSLKADATTQLYHFDGKQWSMHGGSGERITSLASVGTDLWLTTAREIRRYSNGKFVTSHTATNETFRACAFKSKDDGYCVGTHGLAVAWNGTSWTTVGNVPWTIAADVFGVEYSSWTSKPVFVYGEPIDHPNGDFGCRAARLSGGTFTTTTEALPCFAEMLTPRKRTGVTIAGFDELVLFAPDDSYGGSLVFDLDTGSTTPLCGPTLTFSRSDSKTRAAGFDGFLAVVKVSGGKQLALDSVNGSDIDFRDLSVGLDGTAWARTETTTSCGAISEQLVRYEDDRWTTVPAPSGANVGAGLAAVSYDRAYTVDLYRDVLLIHEGERWVDGPVIESAWSLTANAPDNVWVGGLLENFGRYDGATFTELHPVGRHRQAESIAIAGNEVWMMQLGVVADDTDQHLVHWADGKVTETNLGTRYAGADIHVSAVDAAHVYVSGHPAMRWDGTKWNKLPFSANDVWMRSEDEVYFTDRGDIWRWDGSKRTLAFHGLMAITHIAGSKDRAFAVGSGGMTIIFQRWPDAER